MCQIKKNDSRSFHKTKTDGRQQREAQCRDGGKTLPSNAEHPGSCKLKSPRLKILCLLPSWTCHLNKTCSFVGCYSLGKAMGLVDKVVKKLRHPQKPFNLPLPQIFGPHDELFFHGLFCIFISFKAYCTPAKAMHSLYGTLSYRKWSGLSRESVEI